jgi:hypothetical protein
LRPRNDKQNGNEYVDENINLQERGTGADIIILLATFRFMLIDVQCPGKILGRIGRDPSVSKTKRLHVRHYSFGFSLPNRRIFM